MDKKGRKSSNTSRTKRKTTNKSTKKRVAGSTNRKPSSKKSSSDQRRRNIARPPVAQQRRNSAQHNRGKPPTQQQKPQSHGGKESSDGKSKAHVSSKAPSRKHLLWDDEDDDDDDGDGSDDSLDDLPIPLSSYVGTHVKFNYFKRDPEYGCFGSMAGWCNKECARSKPSKSTCWGACGIMCCSIGSIVTLFGFIVSWALCTTHPTLISGVVLIVFGCLVALFALVIYPRVRTTRQQQQRIGDIDDMRVRGFNASIDGATTPVPDRVPSGIIPSAPPIPLSYSLDLSTEGGGCAASWPMRGRRRHSEPYVIVVNETNTFPRISNYVNGDVSSVVNLWEPMEAVTLMDQGSRELNAELSVIYENEINEESDTTSG